MKNILNKWLNGYRGDQMQENLLEGNKECEGCKVYAERDDNKAPPYCKMMAHELSCPCPTCLVKMICEVPCDLFREKVVETQLTKVQ
jgi:hypothetical protein